MLLWNLQNEPQSPRTLLLNVLLTVLWFFIFVNHIICSTAYVQADEDYN